MREKTQPSLPLMHHLIKVLRFKKKVNETDFIQSETIYFKSHRGSVIGRFPKQQ